jgi:hypothetical protein
MMIKTDRKKWIERGVGERFNDPPRWHRGHQRRMDEAVMV